jgi:hypothetical protein
VRRGGIYATSRGFRQHGLHRIVGGKLQVVGREQPAREIEGELEWRVVQRPSARSHGVRLIGLNLAESATLRQKPLSAALAPEAPPDVKPEASTTPFIAPAELPDIPSRRSRDSSSAIMGGLFVATMLTLIVLPALYVIFLRVKEEPPVALPSVPQG